MSDFDAYNDFGEQQFSFQEKHDFNVEAKCSKLFGLWAAEKIGLSGSDATTYAMTIVEANLEEPGFDDVLRAVQKDFDTKGLTISKEEQYQQLDACLSEAKRQIDEEK